MYKNKKQIQNKSFSKLFEDIKDSSYDNSSYYECYKKFLKNQKDNNKLILQKINKYENLSNINKNADELNIHKNIWINYLNYSVNLKNKIEKDILNILSNQISNATNKDLIKNIDSYINNLTINNKEYENYKNGTIANILSLLKSLKTQRNINNIDNDKNSIKNNILKINERIGKELELLELEEKELSNQVSKIYNKYENEINFGNNNPWIIDNEIGKPCHFLDLTCLNEEFKNICSDKYIQFINMNMDEIFKSRPNKKSIQNFQMIEKLYEEYMKSSNNRFILLQERISNELKTSKSEAKNLIDMYHEYLRQKNNYKSHIKNFITQRNEMINEIIDSIKNINEDLKKRNINEKNKEKQLELIEKLHLKLKKWREEKILKLKEEEKVENLKKLEIMKLKKIENKKKELRKIKNQQRLNRYYQIIEERERQRKIEEEEAKKLEEIKQIEISKYNQERIDFRKKEYQNHLLEKQKKKEEEIKIKQLQELHLEKIRASVGISAEIDPERVKKPTISSLKSKSVYEKDNIFDIIGYSDKQIIKDKRFRVTEALQRQGLLHSDYAKSVISLLTPTSNKYRNKSEITFN